MPSFQNPTLDLPSQTDNKKESYNANKIFEALPLLIPILFSCGIIYLYHIAGAIILFLIVLPGVPAYWLWYLSFYRGRINSLDILPIYLATVAGFIFHSIEEYTGSYSLAISRIFNFPWTEERFVIVLLTLGGILILVAIGLYYKNLVAGFVATLFIITRFAELALFIFPLLPPEIQPVISDAVTATIKGIVVENMPSYFINATGRYYFPGMFTILLPSVPAIFYVKNLLLTIKKFKTDELQNT